MTTGDDADYTFVIYEYKKAINEVQAKREQLVGGTDKTLPRNPVLQGQSRKVSGYE